MKSADLTRVIESYEIFKAQRLLFTRLDETGSYGPIFNEAVRTGKPVSFLANGQRIPEDLEAASPERLVQLIRPLNPVSLSSTTLLGTPTNVLALSLPYSAIAWSRA